MSPSRNDWCLHHVTPVARGVADAHRVDRRASLRVRASPAPPLHRVVQVRSQVQKTDHRGGYVRSRVLPGVGVVGNDHLTASKHSGQSAEMGRPRPKPRTWPHRRGLGRTTRNFVGGYPGSGVLYLYQDGPVVEWRRTRTITPPSDVKLMAFSRRLSRTWRTIRRSVKTVCIVDVCLKRDALLDGPGSQEQPRPLPQPRPSRWTFGSGIPFAPTHPGEIEHVINEREQMLARCAHHLELAALFFVQLLRQGPRASSRRSQ